MPARKSVPKSKKLPFKGRLSKSHAQIKIHSFGDLSFFVEMSASLKGNKVSDFGFDTNGPDSFSVLLSKGCSMFVGLSHDEAESVSVEDFSSKLKVSSHEKQHALYAWTVIQDVISRLPFNNPLSNAIGKISKHHDEFPMGEMGMDSED